MKLTPRPASPRETCPYCRDAIAQGPAEACSGCGARYHFECLVDELSGACAVLGCGVIRSAPPSADTCADCGRGFVTESPRTCPGCAARYHLDCVRGRDACSRPGCGAAIGTRNRRRPRTTSEETEERRGVVQAVVMMGCWIGGGVLSYRSHFHRTVGRTIFDDPQALVALGLFCVALLLFWWDERKPIALDDD